MPRYWHDRHSVNQIEDPDERRFQLSIVADKKPYFMRIVYPALARQYNTYIKTANKNARREFGLSLEDLELIPESQRTERQNDFIRYYYSRLPVGIGDCVMNKICRRVESEFDGYLKKRKPVLSFDIGILKSKTPYTKTEFSSISRLYDSYRKRLQQFMVFRTYERIDEYEATAYVDELRLEFERECNIACPNIDVQCNIVLDLCYTRAYSKRFAWEMCGSQIIKNLLSKNENRLVFPTLDDNGDISFKGHYFRVTELEVEVEDGDCIE